jgi:AraC family transcriptional regulator
VSGLSRTTRLLQLLSAIRRRLDANVSLDALASRAGWSPFHLHRAFTRMVGETPKQYTLRLRLEGAGAAARQRRLHRGRRALGWIQEP